MIHFQLKEAGKIVIIRSAGLSCLRGQNLINSRSKTIKLYMFRMQVLTSTHFKSNMELLCSHEIKRHLLLGRKAMKILDSILKSRDITLPTKGMYSQSYGFFQ